MQQLDSGGLGGPGWLISALSARRKNKAIRLIEVLSLPQINETSEALVPILDINVGSFVAIAKFPGKLLGPG